MFSQTPVEPLGQPDTSTITPISNSHTSRGISKNRLLLYVAGLLALLIVGLAVACLDAVNENSTPLRVRVTNLTDRSATVSWITEEASTGVVIYDSNNSFKPFILGSIGEAKAYDDRDVSAAELEHAQEIARAAASAGTDNSLNTMDDIDVTHKEKYFVHHVTLTKLEPATTYYFKVGNGLLFSSDPSSLANDSYSASTSFSLTTLPESDELLTPIPAYGAVVAEDTVVDDGIAFMTFEDRTDILPLSGILNDTGKWYIDLSNARLASGQPVDDFDDETDTEVMLIDAGQTGFSENITVPMNADSPAETINLTDVYFQNENETGSKVQKDKLNSSILSNAYAAPANCPQSDPCSVSPVDMRIADTTNPTGYQTIDATADFGSLQEAITWANASGSESWFLLLSGGRTGNVGGRLQTPKHVWQAGTSSGGSSGIVLTPITGSMHLIGDTVENMYDMPEVVSYIINESTATTPPANWPANVPYNPPTKIFGLSPRLAFSGSAHSSVENIYFGLGASASHFVLMTKDQAEDVTKIYSTILSQNSTVDVKGCRFESHSNADRFENGTIDYYRVAAVKMENSSGTIASNLVFGYWAGGVYATGSSTDVIIRNNGIDARWFMAWIAGGKANIYGNVFSSTDPRLYNECFKANPAASAVEHCTEYLAKFPGGIPIWDYPVFGVVASGLSSIDMQYNTVDGPDTILKLASVPTGTITRNVWLQGHTGAIANTGSSGVSTTNNLLVSYTQKMTSEISREGCSVSGSTSQSTIGGLTGSGRAVNPLCGVIPAAGSQIETLKVGATFAQGWENSMLYHGEIGCTTIPPQCVGLGTISCDAPSNTCLKAGEDATRTNSVPIKRFPAGIGGTTTQNSDDGLSNDQSISRLFPASPVYAAQTYTVTDDYVLVPDSDGVYDIIIPGVGTSDNAVLLGGEKYIFFLDGNENGQWDDGEEQIDIQGLAIDLAVDDGLDVFDLTLTAGSNFISFEYLPEQVDSCTLIEKVNTTSVDQVSQIARFESGAYEVTSYQRDLEEPLSGKCFPVVPGRGYIVMSVGDETIAASGYKLAEPAGVGFDSAGWHLAGINGGSKMYTASSLLDSINETEGLAANNVTRWLSSASKYEGLQKEADTVYGFDFPIEPSTSYFIRVTEGSGVWTPE